PQVSPDGNYWWNGTQWVPFVQPGLAQPPSAQPFAQQPAAPYSAQPLTPPPDNVSYATYSANAAGGRWSRGWRIGKLSWAVIRSDKQLLLLPVFSFISFVVMLALFAIPAVTLQVWAPENRV